MRGSGAFRTSIVPGGALAGPWVANSLWKNARAVPSLDLRFAENKSLTDAKTGASLVTFTRARTGTYVGSDGVLQGAVTNLQTFSEEFNNAAYGAAAGSVTEINAGIAPNGTSTADEITSTGGGIFRSLTVVTATVHTASVYAKYVSGGASFSFGCDSNPANGRTVFNLQTGVITSNGANVTSSSIVPAGNDWYRCTVTFTSTSTSITLVYYNATSGSKYLTWGAQLEQSSTVGEYIPTTSTINSAPRFDHNPTTGESLGLLVEEARTNLVTWSQDFSQTDWTKASSTIVATAVASPIQGVNYQKIEATSANTTVGITSAAVTAATQQRAVSFFAQSLGNISRMLVVVQGADARININLVDGTFTTNATATGSTVSVSGQRFSVSTPTLTLATGVRFFLKRTGETDTSTTTTIAIGEGLYLTGAQMEAGAFATSYIPTTTATVTRAADVVSITGTNFSSWYNQTEGTVFANGSTSWAAGNFVGSSDNTNNNRIFIGIASGPVSRLLITTSGSSVAAITVPYALNTLLRGAGGYKENSSQFAANGVLGTEDTNCTIPTVNKLSIGSNTTSSDFFLNGTIQRLTYWPVRLGDNVLQQITAP